MLSQGRKFVLEQLYSYMISDQQLIVYQIMLCNAFFSRKFKKVVYNLYPRSKINQRRFNYIFQELLYNEIWHSIYLKMLSACTVHWQYLQVAIYVLIKACSYSGHIHIFTGASVQFLLQIFVQVCLCTLFCRCAVASCIVCYRNVRCRPWLGILWSSSEQSGLLRSF